MLLFKPRGTLKDQKTSGTVLASFQAFINVFKHLGPILVDLDPRSQGRLLGSKIRDYRKTSWIQGLDPGCKISEKVLGSKVWIQDPRLQKKLLGSWIHPGKT